MKEISLYGGKASGAEFLGYVLEPYLGIKTYRTVFMETDAFIRYSIEIKNTKININNLVCPAYNAKYSIPEIMKNSSHLFYFISNIGSWHLAGLKTTVEFIECQPMEYKSPPITLVINSFSTTKTHERLYSTDEVLKNIEDTGLKFLDTITTQIGVNLDSTNIDSINNLLEKFSH